MLELLEGSVRDAQSEGGELATLGELKRVHAAAIAAKDVHDAVGRLGITREDLA